MRLSCTVLPVLTITVCASCSLSMLIVCYAAVSLQVAVVKYSHEHQVGDFVFASARLPESVDWLACADRLSSVMHPQAAGVSHRSRKSVHVVILCIRLILVLKSAALLLASLETVWTSGKLLCMHCTVGAALQYQHPNDTHIVCFTVRAGGPSAGTAWNTCWRA
jgi:hypothetical protein